MASLFSFTVTLSIAFLISIQFSCCQNQPSSNHFEHEGHNHPHQQPSPMQGMKPRGYSMEHDDNKHDDNSHKDDSNENDDDVDTNDSANVGAIIGITVLVVTTVTALIVGIILFRRKCKFN